MNTELYKVIKNKVLESGLSIRAFTEKYDIPRAWFTEFMSKTMKRRVLRLQTMSMLHNKLGIDYEVIEKYNAEIGGE